MSDKSDLELMMRMATGLASDQNKVFYVHKSDTPNFKYIAKPEWKKGWLFKVWPGGRKILSVEGAKIVEEKA